MSTTSIRINRSTHEKLSTLSRRQGKPISKIVEELIADHERLEFFEGLGADFNRLREDPEAYNSYREEVSEWDATLLDGLDLDPWS